MGEFWQWRLFFPGPIIYFLDAILWIPLPWHCHHTVLSSRKPHDLKEIFPSCLLCMSGYMIIRNTQTSLSSCALAALIDKCKWILIFRFICRRTQWKTFINIHLEWIGELAFPLFLSFFNLFSVWLCFVYMCMYVCMCAHVLQRKCMWGQRTSSG